MPGKRYSLEVINFIKEHTADYSDRELSELVNKQFNLNTDGEKINKIRIYRKINLGKKNFGKGNPFYKGDLRVAKYNNYDQDIIDFIKANADYTDRELSVFINKLFNINTTREVIKGIRRYNKIKKYSCKSGEGRPHLSEIKKGGGYTYIKTESGEWINKSKYLWEQANGKVPEGYYVIFLDGNRNNFNLENLIIITKEENAVLNKSNLRFNDPEYTKTGIAIVKHKQAIGKRLKNRCNNVSHNTT